MKSNFRYSFSSLTLLLVVFVLSSCGGGSSKKEESSKQEAFAEAEKKISKDLTEVVAEMPAPTEVPYLLQATGSDFNDNLINGLDNLSKYQTNQNESAVNLGVYATDMGYLLSYDKSAETREYMEACQGLAESLGIASVFDVKTMEDFQDNINNSDSLNKILVKAIAKAQVRLQQSDRMPVAALVLSGSFIEGLYLAVEVVETYPTDILDETNRNLILEPLVKVILDQKKPLVDIIGMLKDLPKAETTDAMIADLTQLKTHYDGSLSEIQTKIANNTGDLMLTQDMLTDVTSEVKRIREDIVAMQ